VLYNTLSIIGERPVIIACLVGRCFTIEELDAIADYGVAGQDNAGTLAVRREGRRSGASSTVERGARLDIPRLNGGSVRSTIAGTLCAQRL